MKSEQRSFAPTPEVELRSAELDTVDDSSPPAAVVASRRGSLASPLTPANTWLASGGWKRAGGPIRFDEAPRRPR